MDVKKAYNITTWHDHKLNYWGIPKCANTSVKMTLLGNTVEDPYSLNKKIHKKGVLEYISRETALSNSYINFTTIRHPYDRFISLYKDWGLRRSNSKTKFNPPVSLDYFIDYVIEYFDTDNRSERHFKSQAYWLSDNNNLLIKNTFNIKETKKFLAKYNLKLVVANKTKDQNVLLTDMQKEKIYKRYENDFLLLGFKNDY